MTSQISAIIAQHINTESRVIIPDVGTLIRRKESGEIVFMEMLKKNDNVLINLVVNILDVSPSKSAELVGQYVAHIKEQIRTHKKFILDGVGVLLLRPDGGLDFSFNPFAQSLPEPDKSYDVIEEIARPRPVVSKPTPAPKPEPKSAPAPKPEVAPTPKPEVATPRKVNVAQENDVEVIEAPKSTPTKPSAVPTRKPAPAPAPAPAPKPAPIIEEEDEEETTESRRPKIRAHHTRKRVDGITIVALIAVALALICIVWGMIPSSESVELNLDTPPTPIEITE
ncbi:MAG: hypothetical protein II323_05995 [Tidjanibacter sp.]|nr:hypothetical protein [Tidjanibacter sp.]